MSDHLVPKKVVDKNGKLTTVRVNPNKGSSHGKTDRGLMSPPSLYTSDEDKLDALRYEEQHIDHEENFGYAKDELVSEGWEVEHNPKGPEDTLYLEVDGEDYDGVQSDDATWEMVSSYPDSEPVGYMEMKVSHLKGNVKMMRDPNSEPYSQEKCREILGDDLFFEGRWDNDDQSLRFPGDGLDASDYASRSAQRAKEHNSSEAKRHLP